MKPAPSGRPEQRRAFRRFGKQKPRQRVLPGLDWPGDPEVEPPFKPDQKLRVTWKAAEKAPSEESTPAPQSATGPTQPNCCGQP